MSELIWKNKCILSKELQHQYRNCNKTVAFRVKSSSQSKKFTRYSYPFDLIQPQIGILDISLDKNVLIDEVTTYDLTKFSITETEFSLFFHEAFIKHGKTPRILDKNKYTGCGKYECIKIKNININPYVAVIDFLDAPLLRTEFQAQLDELLISYRYHHTDDWLKKEEEIYSLATKYNFTVHPIITARKSRSKKRLIKEIEKIDDLDYLINLEGTLKKKAKT